MDFFKSDLFKMGILVVLILSLVFFCVDRFVLSAFDLTARVEQRNEQLNRKVANTILMHKAVKQIFKQSLVQQEVECLEDYISKKALNLQLDDIKAVSTAIVKHANNNEISVPLAVAIAQTQSNFNPTYVGQHGRRGIMQVSVSSFSNEDKKPDARTLHAIDYNLKVGIAQLADKLKAADTDLLAGLLRFSGDKSKDGFITEVTNNLFRYLEYREQHINAWLKNFDVEKCNEQVEAELKLAEKK